MWWLGALYLGTVLSQPDTTHFIPPTRDEIDETLAMDFPNTTINETITPLASPPDGAMRIYTLDLPPPPDAQDQPVQQTPFDPELTPDRRSHIVPGAALALQYGESEGGLKKQATLPEGPPPQAPAPDVARTYGTAVIYEGDKIVIFGGMDEHRRYRNDAWSYSIRDDRWERLQLRGGRQPSRRIRHVAVKRYNEMIIFGGHNGWRFLNDVWALDLDALVWNKVYVRGWSPARREETAAVYAENSMWIVMGYRGWFYDDVWQLEFSEPRRWHRRWSPYGKKPRPRANHGAVFEEYIYIFGGHDWWTLFNDLWRFDTKTALWQEVSPNGPSPPPRCSLGMVSRGKIYIFGGWGGRHELNDLWVWDLPSNQWNMITWDTTFVRVPRLSELGMVLRGDELFVHGGWGGTSSSARTYAINVINPKARTVGWVPRVRRLLSKDDPAYRQRTSDQF